MLTTLCLLLSFAAGQDSVGVVYQTAPEVSRHEPVVTTLVVENRTQEEIRFDLGFDRTEHVVAVVKKPDGNAWPLSLRTIGDGVRRRGRISIEPGGRYVQRFVLDRWIDFDQIGDYELEIQANVAVTTKNGALVSGAISGTTRTRMTARNEQRLRDVGRTLAETVLSGRTEDSSDAAQELQYMVDEVAVPYVARILSATDSYDSMMFALLIQIKTPESRAVLGHARTAGSVARAVARADLARMFEGRQH